MVEYEYEELFYNHSRVDLLIVESGASLTWNSTTEQFDVEDSDFVIRTEDVESESFELDERLCSRENLTFGLCESAHFSIMIYNRTTIPNLTDKIMGVFIYFNNDPDTIFAVGVYQVKEDNYVAGRVQREISAYDFNYYLYDLDITAWYDRYFDDGNRHMIGLALVSLFNWINGTSDPNNDSPNIPVHIESGYNLCNGTYTISKTIESDTITFGMFVSGLLEFNGCFGHINRQGNFEFKILRDLYSDPVRTVTDTHRFPPTNYDDINTWGIGGIDVYDRTNVRKFKIRNTDKKHPSIYVMVDPFVLADVQKGNSTAKSALEKMHNTIIHMNYNPSETECVADLCVEVGDKIHVEFVPSEGDTRTWFRTYVFERHVTGLQGMTDVYEAQGDKKQPKYTIKNDRWHNGDSTDSSTEGEGGVSVIDAEEDRKLIAKQRNYGEPMLDEPTDVEVVYNKSSQQVEIKWTDPDDIDTYTPLPIEWEGTVVVRKEGSPPLHPFGDIDEYGGTVIETETTKNSYQSTAFVDDTIEPNKKYYYAIMPYFVKLDDADHPVNQYRWTKVVSVDTERIITAPTIMQLTLGGKQAWDGSEIEIMSSGENNTLTVQIDNNSLLFTMYTGTTEIYSFTGEMGSTITDLANIHIGFLIDSNLQLAKPSFAYMDSLNSYSYNQEQPTDAEMALIYTWLSAGLPSE